MTIYMATPTERYHNHGIYADLIKQYIAHKRSLGYKMEDIEERLGSFDRLTIERKETVIGITEELYEAYAQHRPMESRCTLYGRLSIIRNFSQGTSLNIFNWLVTSLISQCSQSIRVRSPHISIPNPSCLPSFESVISSTSPDITHI